MVAMFRSRTQNLAELGLQPSDGEDMGSHLRRLNLHGLTDMGQVFDRPPDQAIPGAAFVDPGVALAQATSRRAVRPLKQDELKALKERFKGSTLEAIWAASGQRRGDRSHPCLGQAACRLHGVLRRDKAKKAALLAARRAQGAAR
jgi:hypothetical protein